MVGINAHQNPWLVSHFGLLVLPPTHELGDLPKGYLKELPKFNGENGITAEDHLVTFQDYTNNMYVEEADVFSRMFIHSLEGEARKWFQNLPNRSITHYDHFVQKSLNKWLINKDHRLYLMELNTINRNNGEIILEFTT